MADYCSQFGTVGWGAEHPEAHNAFMYGVYGNNTTVDQVNCASSWGDMINRVACAIATGPNYFKKGRYTIEAICSANDNVYNTQTLSTLSPSQAALGSLNNNVYSIQTISDSSDSPTQAALDGLFGINYIDSAINAGTAIHIIEVYSKRYGVPLPPQVEEIALLTFGMELTVKISDTAIGEERTEKLKDLVNRLVDTRAIIDYAQRWAYGIYSLTFPIYVDPAGYIYDVDTGQRISGASVWLQRPDVNGGWGNVSTGENPPVAQPDTNPLISDKDGMYQWDTLPGSYRVHVESPGYEPADSIVVSVPPPVFDLHVGLHHIYDPNVPPILPVANFSNDISSGYAPLSVQFTDLSESATGISWDFGDGSSSTDRYPIHTYSTVGTYTVTLTASNGNGVNSKTGTINVQAVPIYPLASFISNVTEGYTPLSVQFTDLSENEAVRNWDFGDGTNSSDQSPLHTYSVAGNYIVTLTVSNDNATDSSFARINVSEKPVSVLPVANFSTIVTSGYVPLSVLFTDLSQNATKWMWDFGDGSNSTQQNTTHTYSAVGTYTVNLTVSNENGANSAFATINVLTPAQKPDVEKPVIQSVVLYPANTTAGSKINITVNATDNIGVVGVTADNAPLVNINGIWQGTITAPSKIGSYSLLINASDAADNVGKTSVPYKVVQLQGGASIAVSPRSNNVVAGNKVTLAIKVKNTQNIDDTFKVRISVSELPVSYQGNLTWFNWTDNVVSLRAGQEIQVPMEVNIPAGATKGRKLFRANVLAGTSKISGFDTGYLVIA